LPLDFDFLSSIAIRLTYFSYDGNDPSSSFANKVDEIACYLAEVSCCLYEEPTEEIIDYEFDDSIK
jgi:hypothetical protein